MDSMKKSSATNEPISEPEKKYSLGDLFRTIGPGAVVCATIIGPGTITTCTLAGVNYQYALLWAVVFSAASAIILQMVTSRLGIAYGKGLADLMHDAYHGTPMGYALVGIILVAIGFGNTAFQIGNISGAVLGMRAVAEMPTWIYSVSIGVVAFILLWTGKSGVIEKFMTVMVFLMCILFVATAFVVKPDIGALLKGLIPSIPHGAFLTTLGVIGTTVVPHVIFMHSSLAAQKWAGRNKENAMKESNFDTIFNLILCGLITAFVIVTGASMYGTGTEITSGLDMAKQLEPLVGPWAKYVFGIGLFAAGITSTLAAPMSTALAVCGIMHWSTDMKSTRFRVIWIIVMVIGTTISAIGYNPVDVILWAQAFNGAMLPISVIILMVGVNKKKMLGKYANTPIWNILCALVNIATIFLAARTLMNVVSSFMG